MFEGELEELLHAKEYRDHAAYDPAEHIGEIIRIQCSGPVEECLQRLLDKRMRELYSQYEAKSSYFQRLLDKYDTKEH